MKIAPTPRFVPILLTLLLASCVGPSQGASPGKTMTLDDFVLTGHYADGEVSFALRARANGPATGAGEVALLTGPVSLTSVPDALTRRLETRNDSIFLTYDQPGALPIDLPFRAQVKEQDGWKVIEFTPAAANIRTLVLDGWPEAAKLELPDASQPVRQNGRVTVNLPGQGPVRLRWKDVPPEGAGKLFFSVDGAAVVTVAPGILQQTNVFTLRVLQGKLEKILLDIQGDGEITSVDGPGILNWTATPGAAEGQRRLTVQLNAPRTGEYQLRVQTQMPLPALPATAVPPRISPVDALSYGGFLRVQNEGAVRMEVLDTTGLSQIAPEQFAPAKVGAPSTQAFAYRFADAGYTYKVRADNVLPEINATSVLTYHLGESDVSLDAEISLDIREAPLRELNLIGPANWAVARLEAPDLSDYFVTPAGNNTVRLRIVFAKPEIDRQVVRLRLERNGALTGDAWDLPPLTVEKVKTARGFVGVTANPGFRLTTTKADNLTDAGPSSFPQRVENLQAAWRFRDDPWAATLKIERLVSTIQADGLQLFSVGQGVIYGSTVLNLQITGAPVTVLRLQNTGNYRNVFFTGRDLRNQIQRDDGVYEVYLQHPTTGAYTLLATYELSFDANGATLPGTGMVPQNVQSEQGYMLIASNHPYNITAQSLSTGLIKLENAEIPAEYQLLTEAPILAAYQYSARPFDATFKLTLLPSERTVDQVVDIAQLDTRVSAAGELRTTASYLIKSKSHDHLRLTLPEGAKLWALTVADKPVVAVADKGTLLIPLPRQGDPNLPLLIKVDYGVASATPDNITVAAPKLDAPVLVTDWYLTADANHRLRPLEAVPVVETPPQTTLGWLGQMAIDDKYPEGRMAFWKGLALAVAGLFVLRMARNRTFWTRLIGGTVAVALGLTGLRLLILVGLSAISANERAEQVMNDYVTAPTINAAPYRSAKLSSKPVHLSVPVVVADHALSFNFASESTPPVARYQAGAWLLLPGALLFLSGLVIRRGALVQALGALAIVVGALGLPHAPFWFCLALVLLLAGLGLRGLRALRSAPEPEAPRGGSPITAAATTMALMFLLWLGSSPHVAAATAPAPAQAAPVTTPVVTPPPPTPAPAPAPGTGVVVSLVQRGSVKDGFVRMTAEVTWRVGTGDKITLLRAPAVLTAFDGAKNDLTLTQEAAGAATNYILTARREGTFKFTFAYEVRADATVVSGGSGNAIPSAASVVLPTPGGLVNEITLDFDQPDLEASAPTAVTLRATSDDKNHLRVVATYSPGAAPALRWVPRARDLKMEKPAYYADWQQLFVPAAGIVDGRHEVRVRLAQGEVKELSFSVPAGLTIANVQADGLTAWRFDPDQHKLLTYFEPARKSDFNLIIRSQAATTPLPAQTTLAPLRLDGATGEVGSLLAIATGTEVQLSPNLTTEGLADINPADFPARVAQSLSTQANPLTVRRAYSYGAAPASIKIEALAVEPDVRVATQQTLSLGEDRLVLVTRLDVTVARAGIFQLSFVLPKGLELETLSGQQLSHWLEADAPEGRVITMYLKSKTQGQTRFDLTLSGPGVGATKGWSFPRLVIREAAKQTGDLAILPELGLRPNLADHSSVTQMDPRQYGITDDRALAFRLLQNDWNLNFDIEKIDPWIQVKSFQDVTVREGITEVRASLDYQIDNAGVRELRLKLPTNAVGVHISGPQVGDTLESQTQPGEWLVRLQRRALGRQNIQVTYQILPVANDQNVALTGLLALGTNVQNGYFAVRARGRLEARVTNPPAALQKSDWESVPAEVRRQFDGTAPSHTFRVVDPVFTLPVEIVHHEAADMLPARVLSADLRSLLSPDGQLLTIATVKLSPGGKRNLNLRLPADAQFWFAFVNDKGVNPSLGGAKGDEILLPLEPHPVQGQPTSVEFFYSQPLANGKLAHDLQLAGPKFDLPLENITWQVFLPDTWALSDWSKQWQQVELDPASRLGAWRTLSDYLNNEKNREKQQFIAANNYLTEGNKLLQTGQQQQARDLFSNAYQISKSNAAQNEDARVQWQNTLEQQALVGLANRRNTFIASNGGIVNNGNIQIAGTANTPPSQLDNGVLSQSAVLNFTDQQARMVLGTNDAQDNAVLALLAQRLVQQQSASLPQPAAIRATLPERGATYKFTQSLQVNPWSDLSLNLTAGPTHAVAWAGLGALGGLALLLLIATGLASRVRQA